MPRFARFFSQTKQLDRKNRGFQGHDENHAIVQSFCVQLQAAQASHLQDASHQLKMI